MVRRTRAAAGQLDEQAHRMAQAIADEVMERMSSEGLSFSGREVNVRVWSEKTTVYVVPDDIDIPVDSSDTIDGEIVREKRPRRKRGATPRVQHRHRPPER